MKVRGAGGKEKPSGSSFFFFFRGCSAELTSVGERAVTAELPIFLSPGTRLSFVLQKAGEARTSLDAPSFLNFVRISPTARCDVFHGEEKEKKNKKRGDRLGPGPEVRDDVSLGCDAPHIFSAPPLFSSSHLENRSE